jgi:predicted nuclease of restriction endonuclease-like (RecB) superfamily
VALPEEIRKQAKLAVKDEYTFDFLELADEHSERQLKQAILAKIEPFLLEMGGMFAFIGSQYRLEVDEKEYFIDLLLYHRRLKSLVAVELKMANSSPSTSARCSSTWPCSTTGRAWRARTLQLAF